MFFNRLQKKDEFLNSIGIFVSIAIFYYCFELAETLISIKGVIIPIKVDDDDDGKLGLFVDEIKVDLPASLSQAVVPSTDVDWVCFPLKIATYLYRNSYRLSVRSFFDGLGQFEPKCSPLSMELWAYEQNT